MDYHKNYHRNKVSTMIDTAKKEAYQTKIEEEKDDPRSIWKLFNQFGMYKKGSSKVNDIEISQINHLNQSTTTRLPQ